MLEISRRKRIHEDYSVKRALIDDGFNAILDEDEMLVVSGGGTGGEHNNRENYCVWPESDGLWTVRCCGEIVFGPATKAAVDAYFNSI